ncbi:hypothetical protein ACHAW6_013891 [Cyclotella cf. meneghiniana]
MLSYPTRRQLTALLAFISPPTPATAWTPPSTTTPTSVPQHQKLSRRGLLQTTAVALLPLLPKCTDAASSPALTPTQRKDIDRIQSGYARLQYLLDHWESETTVCKTGQETTFGDRCQRTPLKVMEYLGYKSINDPLFRADVTLGRLKPLVPEEREEEYYEAVEEFAKNAEEANGMAFVSSWGEANPGGGKDRVELFIERSRRNVVASRDSLGVVLDILGLRP